MYNYYVIIRETFPGFYNPLEFHLSSFINVSLVIKPNLANIKLGG